MATDAAPTFAQLLRRHRLAAGLTQEALAEAAGLSARAVRSLERGERTVPHQDTVQLLGGALGLTTADAGALGAAVERRRSPRAPLVGREALAPPALPVPLTSFVGREAEVEALRVLLGRDGARLLT